MQILSRECRLPLLHRRKWKERCDKGRMEREGLVTSENSAKIHFLQAKHIPRYQTNSLLVKGRNLLRPRVETKSKNIQGHCRCLTDVVPMAAEMNIYAMEKFMGSEIY